MIRLLTSRVLKNGNLISEIRLSSSLSTTTIVKSNFVNSGNQNKLNFSTAQKVSENIEAYSKKSQEISSRIDSNLMKCRNLNNKSKYFQLEISRIKKNYRKESSDQQTEIIILFKRAAYLRLNESVRELFKLFDETSKYSVFPMMEALSYLISDGKIVETASTIDFFVSRIPLLVNQEGFQNYLKPISKVYNQQQFTKFISTIYRDKETDLIYTLDRIIKDETDEKYIRFIYQVFASLIADGSNKMFKRVFRHSVLNNDLNSAMHAFQDMKQYRVLPSAEVFQRLYEFSLNSKNSEAFDQLIDLNFKLLEQSTFVNKIEQITLGLVYNQIKSIKVLSTTESKQQIVDQDDLDDLDQDLNGGGVGDNVYNNEINQFKLKDKKQYPIIFQSLKQMISNFDQNTIKSIISNVILGYLKLNQYELALQWFRDSTSLYNIAPHSDSFEWFIIYHSKRLKAGTIDNEIHSKLHAYWISMSSIYFNRRKFLARSLAIYDNNSLNKDLYLMEYLDGNTQARGFPLIHSVFLPKKFNDPKFKVNSTADLDYALKRYIEKGKIPDTFILPLVAATNFEKGNFKLFSKVPQSLGHFFIYLDFRLGLNSINEVLLTFKSAYFGFYPQLEKIYSSALENTLGLGQLERSNEIFYYIIRNNVQLSDSTLKSHWLIDYLEKQPITSQYTQSLPELIETYFKNHTPIDDIKVIKNYQVRLLLHLNQFETALNVLKEAPPPTRNLLSLTQFINTVNILNPITLETTLDQLLSDYYNSIYVAYFKTFDLEYKFAYHLIGQIGSIIWSANNYRLLVDFILHFSTLGYKIISPDLLIYYIKSCINLNQSNWFNDKISFLNYIKNDLIKSLSSSTKINTVFDGSIGNTNSNSSFSNGLEIYNQFNNVEICQKLITNLEISIENKDKSIIINNKEAVDAKEKLQKEQQQQQQDGIDEKYFKGKVTPISDNAWVIFKLYANYKMINNPPDIIYHSSLNKF